MGPCVFVAYVCEHKFATTYFSSYFGTSTDIQTKACGQWLHTPHVIKKHNEFLINECQLILCATVRLRCLLFRKILTRSLSVFFFINFTLNTFDLVYSHQHPTHYRDDMFCDKADIPPLESFSKLFIPTFTRPVWIILTQMSGPL